MPSEVPDPALDRLLDLFPGSLPDHLWHPFSLGVVEVGQGIEDMPEVFDAELLAIPRQHVPQDLACLAKGVEIDEILPGSPLGDRRKLHAREIPETGEAAFVLRPGEERIEHGITEFEEADADLMNRAVQRASRDLAGLERNTIFPDLSCQTQGIGQPVREKPVEIHGAAMAQVQGDRRTSRQVEAPLRRPRTQEMERLSLPRGQDLDMEAHGWVRWSQTSRRPLRSHRLTRRAGMPRMSCQNRSCRGESPRPSCASIQVRIASSPAVARS